MKRRPTAVLLAILLFSSSLRAQTPRDWQAHRAAFLRHLSSRSVALFKAAEVTMRNGDVEHAYRQDSNFYYLTGCPEPEAKLLLVPAGLTVPGHTQPAREILFVRPRNPHAEMWEGPRLGVAGAQSELGFAVVLPTEAFDRIYRAALAAADTLYLETGRPESYHPASPASDSTRSALEALLGVKLEHPGKILNRLREVKSPAEIALLRRAIAITCEAQRTVMASAQTGMREYELQAMLEYVFTKNGSPRLGFPSIVGSGPNSCILHYRAGDRQTQPGDLVVIDIGAEYGMYTADVTRTIPISGKFSREQAAIYNIVLAAQEAAVALVKPGVGFQDLRAAAVRVIVEGLIKLDILKGTVEENVRAGTYRDFFPHGLSHYLGLDVHDAGTYGPLQAGTVFTIEPGIYISAATAKKHGLPERYANLGVRIEDDILVTETGYENLSAGAPRSVAEIEALMAQTGQFEKMAE
ncbi:MAG: aminopeptidase P N-terminal domain-containing protein [candidate division KSB1 bacterium]|nr:aminopeptidase P N-terminal domain-containing protein [candidate division KSB1 bacterium]MDZ7275410.1 aminopeptidase P N-terminal domain-containing protein [candidate division KSB1 bacterium]MDZ7286278.1 aminopeptidase P N-terminal domain-containing protein [candidate division KSB1 bacterium]MDZ7296504.1 aminopeptidase P N-terminal domain-containing protein [candidate division KSB1 bacterium]MDZ7305538.1 aminopeptidase P N-terminal domain-containing protein [candidate division KSB1 bacterium